MEEFAGFSTGQLQCVDSRSRRSCIAAVHCRRPCVSRGCGASVEQSARFRHGVNVAANVQATPVDCTVREKLLNSGCFRRLEHLPSHVILFAYNFVRCPCSRSDRPPYRERKCAENYTK